MSSSCRRLAPLGAVACGMLPGAGGTAAMDLVWFARYERKGGDQEFLASGFSAGLDDWERAPAPAQVGRRLEEAFLQRELPRT